MTVADTIYDTINDNWGNGGYGGTTPAITTSETAKQPDGVTADVIEVRHFAGTGYDEDSDENKDTDDIPFEVNRPKKDDDDKNQMSLF